MRGGIPSLEPQRGIDIIFGNKANQVTVGNSYDIIRTIQISVVNIKIQMANQFDFESESYYDNVWSNCEPELKGYCTQEEPLSHNPQLPFQSLSEPTPATSSSGKPSHSPKDSNPNLLKNLVATLRSWVDIREEKHGKHEAEVWRYFKQQKKINKSLVWFVYGRVEDDRPAFRKLADSIPGLAGIEVENFKKLQATIRQQTLQQLKKADIEYILKYRRVQNRQEFSNYFYSFVDKLSSGLSFEKKNPSRLALPLIN